MKKRKGKSKKEYQEYTEGATSSVLDVLTRIWVGYAFDPRARVEIMRSCLSATLWLPTYELMQVNCLLRVDSGSQYRSRELRESTEALGIKLEFIF